MPQNIVSLTVSPETARRRAAGPRQPGGQPSLTWSSSRSTSVSNSVKMGPPGSEAFVREGLMLLEANPELLPRSFDLTRCAATSPPSTPCARSSTACAGFPARADDTEMASAVTSPRPCWTVTACQGWRPGRGPRCPARCRRQPLRERRWFQVW